jgi:hypothetical protein
MIACACGDKCLTAKRHSPVVLVDNSGGFPGNCIGRTECFEAAQSHAIPLILDEDLGNPGVLCEFWNAKKWCCLVGRAQRQQLAYCCVVDRWGRAVKVEATATPWVLQYLGHIELL